MNFYTENITKSYAGNVIIEDINIRIESGEKVALLGASGVGKTTLFNVLSGLEKPDSGYVFLGNKNITAIAGKVGYMQQEDLLLPFRTTLDNVIIPLILKGASKKDARAQAAPMLELFGLDGSERKYPSQLSGGMRQRAALLRAYMHTSDVMLLDEPFSALDAMTKDSMHRWFNDLTKKQSISALIITHDIDEAITLSNKVYIMSENPGRITAEVEIDAVERDENFAVSDEFIMYKKKIKSLYYS